MKNIARTVGIAAAASLLAATSAFAADGAAPSPIRNRAIGYVVTTYAWAIQTTEAKSECPEGMNSGPIEQFNVLYPPSGKRKVTDTVLKREAQVLFPDLAPEQFAFKEAVSKVAPGLNLDGKTDANDFVDTDGRRGIDNQLYRVIGCIGDYRPGGSLSNFINIYGRTRNYTRMLVELTDVDSLENDDDVTVSTYRGIDPLLGDASGSGFVAFSSQRVDERFGKVMHKRTKGKIVGGVLLTDPVELEVPITMAYNVRSHMKFRDGRLELQLLPEAARGVVAGYLDINSFYRAVNKAYATYHQNYGGQTAQSVYRALHRLADAHPDANGQNTAISGAMRLEMRQVFIEHPEKAISSVEPAVQTASGPSAQKASRE